MEENNASPNHQLTGGQSLLLDTNFEESTFMRFGDVNQCRRAFAKTGEARA